MTQQKKRAGSAPTPSEPVSLILNHEGIWSKIVHRWPEDELGETLDPTQGDPLPPDLMAKDAARIVEAIPEAAE